ncbi:MAG: STAS/SEC14 domain-containing protein [Pseudomonadota bacterium]
MPVEEAHVEERLELENTVLHMHRYRGLVLLFEVKGHLGLSIAQSMIAWAEKALEAHGKIHALHDWKDVSGYTAAGRLELTRFLFVHRHRFLSAHLLVLARDVEFGVEVANIVLKNKINVHHDISTFNRALDFAIRSATLDDKLS